MGNNVSATGVPVLSKEKLEDIAEVHTARYARLQSDKDTRLSTWRFAVHHLGKKVRFERLSHNGWILGLSVFADGTRIPVYQPKTGEAEWAEADAGTILLDKSLEVAKDALHSALSRPRFTLMHECAHQLLHSDYYRRIAASGNDGAVAYSVQRSGDTIDTQREPWRDVDWIEWQANYLAGALLIPRSRLVPMLKNSAPMDDYRTSVAYKHSEDDAFKTLSEKLAWIFQTSPRTAELRLQHVGFKRLPDLYERKPDPWGPCAFPEPEPRTRRRDIKEQRIFEKWEYKQYKAAVHRG